MRLDLTTANVVVAILIVGNDKQQCARAFLVLDQPACILVAIWSTGVFRLNTLTACPHTFRFCKSDHWHRFANGVLNGWSVFAFIFHFFAWPCFISVRVCRPGARRVSNVAACVLEREVHCLVARAANLRNAVIRCSNCSCRRVGCAAMVCSHYQSNTKPWLPTQCKPFATFCA